MTDRAWAGFEKPKRKKGYCHGWELSLGSEKRRAGSRGAEALWSEGVAGVRVWLGCGRAWGRWGLLESDPPSPVPPPTPTVDTLHVEQTNKNKLGKP